MTDDDVTALMILVVVLVTGLLAMVVLLYDRVIKLGARLNQLESAQAIASFAAPAAEAAVPPPAPPPASPARAAARIVARVQARDAGVEAAPPLPPLPPPIEPATIEAADPQPFANFESLVGGRLPIWVGGAALVLAAFFLVRYSIESGLLGPGVRVVLAAIFGLVLVAASELARRWPATAEDPRIAQALAGAGIASLYGTLYMAGELYALIGAGTAFALLLVVTAGALALSLRHGPPTAIMGLIGGFAAPLVTGYSESSLLALLVYLALFTTALFALAILRGWTWLAIAAASAGFAWSLWLIASITGPGLAWVGPFVLLLAIGAALALPRREAEPPLLRAAPLALGLLQLVLLAPRLDFSPLAWALYLVLAAATIWLAVRDARLIAAPYAALALALAMLAAGFATQSPSAPLAAIAFAALFAAAGHWLAGRDLTLGRLGAVLALGGAGGPVLLARAGRPDLAADTGWAALMLVGAAVSSALAWRFPRAEDEPIAHVGAPLLAAGLAVFALAPLLPDGWTGAVLAAAMVGLALWARLNNSNALFVLPALAFAAAIVAAWEPLASYAWTAATSLGGNRTPFVELPAIAEALPALAIPAIAALALLRDPRQFGRWRGAAQSIAAAVAILLAYHLVKLPLAIDDADRFLRFGFVERAAITQLLFAAAWLLATRTAWRRLASALVALALLRFVWFDLLLLNPAWVAQAVGSIPLANAAVIHTAGAAAWLWLLARAGLAPATNRRLSLLGAVIALAALVRQATHGSIMTGDIGSTENWLYSAAWGALAMIWLARGLKTGARDLRLASLALMVVVTLKVFLIDASFDGLGRVVSLFGLGVAAMVIGWAYGRVLRTPKAEPEAAQGS